ncbi:MAG: hypothetical protein KF889_12525 [Alphaproteobacteria bacterium]|nr:hypothetical protein [Alphaproteobacteria bacterium]MCW5739182.1 hypothetical protein [Alphaproteobacteria bacterium]
MRRSLLILWLLAAWPAVAQQTSGSIEIESLLEGRKTITPDWRAINALPLGDKGNPVRVHRPAGQRAYLARLLCTGGGTPTFSRIGSFGVGPYGTIVDAYNVACGANAARVFMDMYHPGHVEGRAVPGFTIRAP